MKALWTKLRGEAVFLVVLLFALAVAYLYVQLRQALADRNDVVHRVELICTAGGSDFAAKDKVPRGAACKTRVAALAAFESATAQASAKTLTDALAEHDARQLTDNLAARAAAEAARDAAHRMETADAEAERRNLVDHEWTAAVNGVAGLRAAVAH